MKLEYFYNIFPKMARFSVAYDAQIHDAYILSQISYRISVIKASNGKSYWYYFLKDKKDAAIAKYLMRRNGVFPEFHWSRFNPGIKSAVLRIPYDNNQSHDVTKQFMNSIQHHYANHNAPISEIQLTTMIETLRKKLH